MEVVDGENVTQSLQATANGVGGGAVVDTVESYGQALAFKVAHGLVLSKVFANP
jgi:hypothetical protein